jgi:uncharacterized protein (DUF362 family)
MALGIQGAFAMPNAISRRELLSSLGASGLLLPKAVSAFTVSAPVAPVAIARCKTYEPSELTPVLDGMFDKLGGLGKLVQGKTVAIKLNFNGGPTVRLGHLPLGDTHWPNPNLLAAAMHLMARAGARRIRLVEGAAAPRTDPFEEHMLDANWDPQQFLRAAPRVEFENTNYTNAAKKFTRLPVPRGGLLFPAYDVNHSYADCDVFVSIAKYKDHPTTGVSTVMKNLFGLTPLTAYGNGAGKWEDNDLVYGNDRIQIMHRGSRQPAMGALPEIDPASPRDDGYRVPRAIADLTAARPVHLAIMDGVKTMAGAQTPDPRCTPIEPGVLMIGTNVVNTAAVAIAAMNYDPRAPKGTVPFERCDNKLLLAEQLGVGSADPGAIEVIGPSIKEVMFDFRALREKRRTQQGNGSGGRGRTQN